MIAIGLIDQATGESVMRWTVRLAVLCYLVRVAVRLRRPPEERAIPSTVECVLWFLGCVACLAHVGCAFHFVHSWSHEAAFEHTAAETDQFTGVRRGEGIWVNYLFSLIWVADVIRVGTARFRDRATSRWMDCSVQVLFALIVINATVVFGPPVYRVLLIPVALFLFWQYRIGQSRASDRAL